MVDMPFSISYLKGFGSINKTELMIAGFGGVAAIVLSFVLDRLVQSCAWKLRTPFFRTLVIFVAAAAIALFRHLTRFVFIIWAVASSIFLASYVWELYHTLSEKMDLVIQQTSSKMDLVKKAKNAGDAPHAVNPEKVFAMQHGKKSK
jgi:hypothetical protein